MEDDTFYYIHEGRMSSGRILGTMHLDIQTNSYMHREQIIGHALNDLSVKYVPENGKYAVMAGQRVVPFHQLYRTKQEAADAYRDQLLEDTD